MSYHPSEVEPKWQAFWEKNRVFEAKLNPSQPKYYALDMFPYPSATGLHVGHPEGYTATDIVSRYKRARGFNVLHPMGWDAFGLPAEQFAIQTGVHPAITTSKAIETFRRQLKSLGFSFDWSREISTADPSYYKWTQYLFTKLYERGLAYQTEVAVNWCPALKTVLANEEVVDGKSERGGHPVFRQPMKQWMLKITDYAERLLADLDGLDWPESTKELQRNWIGKSEGLQLRFAVEGKSESLEIFTTRPDTLWGATFMVIAPEHPGVEALTTREQQSEVLRYVDAAKRKTDLDRQDQKEKTGVFTGSFAVNPVNGARTPIWVADYVLMGYGTGAIMAVPAHDDRDHAFATRYQLPIVEVVKAPAQVTLKEGECFTGDGTAVNSGFIDGLSTREAFKKVCSWAEEKSLGKKTTKYKLRDWLFSRQRYWGEPFPIIHLENGTRSALPLDVLPVTLPDVQSYEPTGTGESPLAGITDWLKAVDPKTGRPARRETDTMPGSAGSSWYFLRYIDPKNDREPWSQEAADYWMPVDLYLGGPEHAVGHLLYARFWTQVFFDAGMVKVKEPFKKLVHQGMILGQDGEKMSKSRGNVINPDDVVRQYGADTLRLYEMFMGPLEKDKPWSTSAIEGVYRFLNRAWRLFCDDAGQLIVQQSTPNEADLRITHKTLRAVTEDIEGLRFNTAISHLMVWVNHFTKEGRRPVECLKPFIQLLAPFAPHMAEELWERMGEKTLLAYAPWPSFDPNLAKDDAVTLAIQVMGKTRGTVEVPAGADQATVEEAAKKVEQVANQLKDKTVKRVIFVPNKILNFIVGMLACVAFASLVSSCASTAGEVGPKLELKDLDSFKAGSTTRKQIQSKYGEPFLTEKRGDLSCESYSHTSVMKQEATRFTFCYDGEGRLKEVQHSEN